MKDKIIIPSTGVGDVNPNIEIISYLDGLVGSESCRMDAVGSETNTPITSERLVVFPGGLVLIHPDSINSSYLKNWYGNGPKLETILLEQARVFIRAGLPVVAYCFHNLPRYLVETKNHVQTIFDTQNEHRFKDKAEKTEQAFITGANNIAEYLRGLGHSSAYLGGIQYGACVKYMHGKLLDIGISSQIEVQLTDGR